MRNIVSIGLVALAFLSGLLVSGLTHGITEIGTPTSSTGGCTSSIIPDYGISSVVVSCILSPSSAGFAVKYWNGDVRGPINVTATAFNRAIVVSTSFAACSSFNCDGGIGGFISLTGGNLLVVTAMTVNSTSQVQLKY